MAHKVTFSLPERELGRADIEFLVKKDAEVLGTLKVSNGSLVWVGKNKQTKGIQAGLDGILQTCGR
jgi:hypothetical protein